MSVRPIVLLGDPGLRLKGEPVTSFGKFLGSLLDDLTHTMRDAPGVGLAAPQIGEPLSVCVVEVEDRLHELVNPRIVRAEAAEAKAAELAALAGDKAGPVAAKAAEITGQAGQKLAEKSRGVAVELRRDAATSKAGDDMSETAADVADATSTMSSTSDEPTTTGVA